MKMNFPCFRCTHQMGRLRHLFQLYMAVGRVKKAQGTPLLMFLHRHRQSFPA
jgi:hypothetical protein